VNASKNKKIKIILAEDQELLRRSFIALLKEDHSFDIIGEAANGKELLELLKQVTPDIVILDIEMPVMNGIEALDIMVKRFPEIKVVILSMHTGTVFISELMTRGARSYLPKNCDADTLFEAIHTVYSEGYYFDKAVSEAMLKGLQKEKSINPLLDELALSERELDILKQLCEGKTNKDISKALKITVATIDYHRGNLYRKTKSKNLVDLLKYAIKNGIVNLT